MSIPLGEKICLSLMDLNPSMFRRPQRFQSNWTEDHGDAAPIGMTGPQFQQSLELMQTDRMHWVRVKKPTNAMRSISRPQNPVDFAVRGPQTLQLAEVLQSEPFFNSRDILLLPGTLMGIHS